MLKIRALFCFPALFTPCLLAHGQGNVTHERLMNDASGADE